jgi:hypothetical protein
LCSHRFNAVKQALVSCLTHALIFEGASSDYVF